MSNLRVFLRLTLLTVVPCMLAPQASAQQADLAGTWRGGGTVVLSSGAKESARCIASFQRRGGDSYSMSATCATSDAKVKQSGTVDRIGSNFFLGDFYNPDFGVSGTVRITVHGNRMSASLKGDAGTAVLTFSR